jgi:hypothetical protein
MPLTLPHLPFITPWSIIMAWYSVYHAVLINQTNQATKNFIELYIW